MADFFMFHKEYAPTGRKFTDSDGVTAESLAGDGWVDSPAKVGVNAWDDSASTNDRVEQISSDFQSGKVKALDNPGFITKDEADELAVLRKRNKELEDSVRQELSLKAQSDANEEEHADKTHEAAGLVDSSTAEKVFGVKKFTPSTKGKKQKSVKKETEATSTSF